MSQAPRKHRRLQPYSWLGAGAVTLGLGAAMVGGTAVAVADAGSDSGVASGTAASSASSSSGTAGTSTRRGPRAAGSSSPAATRGAAAIRQSRAAAVTVPTPADATTPAPAAVETPAAAVPTARAGRRAAAASSLAVAAPTAAVQPVDPPYVPNTIVPGQHVTSALNEIAGAQTTLNQATWGAGALAAGIAAIVPQLFLAEASLSLTLWQNNMPGAQQLVAATAGIPIIQQLTEVNLFVTATLPTFAQFGLGGAALFLPLVNLFGAVTAPTQQLVSQARSDGTVYSVSLVQMKSGTEPVITGSIGGQRTAMLIDTGSSGLVTTRDQVGTATPTDQTGEIIYSGASKTPFTYRVYQTTVDFGGGATTGTTYVDVIEDTPAQEAAFKDFVASTGSNAILGTGAAAVGPGPGYIPTSQLPGELSDGYLLNERLGPFGLFGVVIFGPNPFPARVTVPGSPYGCTTSLSCSSQLQVQINSGPKTSVTNAIIDSGGVYGTLPASLSPGWTAGTTVPAGTKISVYTADGQTLLYSYTTNSTNGPDIVDLNRPQDIPPYLDPTDSTVNTGYVPFNQQLIYTDYSSKYPYGATVFDIA